MSSMTATVRGRCNQPNAQASKKQMKAQVAKMINRIGMIVLIAGVMWLAAGCVERRVEYVPVYRAQAGSQAQPQPGQQALHQPQPGTVVTPSTNWQSPEPTPAYTNAPAVAPVQQPATAVAPLTPPPQQVEVVPVAPGPDYYWVPGYWYWGGPGWIWVGGRWTVRPWHGAIWVHGGWGRGRGGWHWHGGHWR